MKKLSAGFTIIEILITIAIIGIMSTIGIVSYTNIQTSTRDSQRSSKISILSEALEKYFEQNGEYPSCDAMTASITDIVTNTFEGLDPSVLSAPSAAEGTNSISCTANPTADIFFYESDGGSYTIAYKSESTGPAEPTKSVVSRKTVAAVDKKTLTTIAGTGGSVSAGGSYAVGLTATITATPDTYYSFSSWTGDTGCSGTASHTITMDTNKTCTANFTPTPISAPSAPVIADPATSDSTYTNWYWNSVSCPGNTTQYRYDYLVDSVSQAPSGWKTPTDVTATTIQFTTSIQDHTYTVQTQARCHNSVADSAWSSTSNVVSYYRPIQYTLAISAGTGGTVNTAVNGSYDSGSTPTITATPNANYNFSSWTGDTGCSGVASHTITINANKTCVANFTPVTYTLAISANAGGTVNTAVNGTYNSGSTPTITATPSSSGYAFSSWTGGGNCAGTASHTILMNANQTCAANFETNFFYRATGVYNSAGSTTAVVAKPTGTVDGDLIFVTIQRAAAVNPSSVPTGWNLVKSNLATYGSWVYYKIASSEGASWTWTWAARAKTMGRAHSFYGGFNTSTPIQSSTVPYSGTASATAIDIPTLTTSSNNTISLLFASGYSTSAKTFAVPANWTEHNETGSNTPDFWQAIASRAFPTSGTATGIVSYPINAASTYRVGLQVMVNMQ